MKHRDPIIDDIRAHREEIIRIAARHGGSDIRVFGSVARGEPGDRSDVDLLIRLDEQRSLLDRIAMMNDLEDLLGRPLDVVNESALHPSLRGRILGEAVAL